MTTTAESSNAEQADVVVVGAGNAGLMAAIEAAELGARVVVLQKLPEPGGKSSLAIGSISAAGTSLQRSRGISDDARAHRRDVLDRIARGGIAPIGLDKLELVLENGAGAIERLIELGGLFSGPHPEVAGEPWRMHVVMPDARALISTLADQARRRGVRIRGDWPADRLLADAGGRVLGVSGARGVVVARRAVVLATGDFSAPPRLEPGRQGPVGQERAFRSWASGDGHWMAESVGAEITHLDRALIPQLRSVDWPHIEPHPSILQAGGIYVNRRGERVVDETSSPAASIVRSGRDEDLFLILDAGAAARVATAADDSGWARDGWLRRDKLYLSTFPGVGYAYLEDVIRAGYGASAPSFRQLGGALDIAPEGLQATVDRYNAAARSGTPDELGRGVRSPLADGPGVFGCGPFRVRSILGRAGIRTDGQLQVLRGDGRPIPQLLAAGAAAGVTGFAYGHGYELAWAIVSGRIAGRTAAASPPAGIAAREWPIGGPPA